MFLKTKKEVIKLGREFDAVELKEVNAENLRAHNYRRVAYSCGAYGVNCALIWDLTANEFFIIKNRNAYLYEFHH